MKKTVWVVMEQLESVLNVFLVYSSQQLILNFVFRVWVIVSSVIPTQEFVKHVFRITIYLMILGLASYVKIIVHSALICLDIVLNVRSVTSYLMKLRKHVNLVPTIVWSVTARLENAYNVQPIILCHNKIQNFVFHAKQTAQLVMGAPEYAQRAFPIIT